MKKFICSVLSVLLLCAMAAANGKSDGDSGVASDNQKITLKWASVHPPIHPASQMMARIAEEISEKTNGRIEIKCFPGSQLGGSKDLIRAVQKGDIDMVSEGAANFGQYVPSATIAEAPYIWRSIGHLESALNGAFGQKINEALVGESGMRMLGAMYYGTRHLSTSTKAIHSVADCAGMNIRVPENDLFVAMAHAWGSNSKPITFSELYLALQYNIVDGQENPLPTDKNAKFYEVTKSITLTNHVVDSVWPAINEKKWQSLTKEQQGWIMEGVKAGTEFCDSTNRAAEAELIDFFKSEGLKVYEADLDAFSKEVLDKYLASDYAKSWDRDLFDKVQAAGN